MTNLIARATALMVAHAYLMIRAIDFERTTPSQTPDLRSGFLIVLVALSLGLISAYGALWATDRGYRIASRFEALSAIIFLAVLAMIVAAFAFR